MEDLIATLRERTGELRNDWHAAASLLAGWARDEEAPRRIVTYLGGLAVAERGTVIARSRETATHFAWCLFDEPQLPMSIWVNEYKDSSRWPTTYANSVHNHRYDFCTLILAGGYRHEIYRIESATKPGGAPAITLRDRRDVRAGEILTVPTDAFHRIPTAETGTLTLLLKARPCAGHSVSYDPASHTSQVHVPIEARFDQLISALAR